VVGPDGATCPAHIFRVTDITGAWTYSPFLATPGVASHDTPGRTNNTAPVLADTSLAGVEDNQVALDRALFAALYTDAEGDSLTWVCVTELPLHGTLLVDTAHVTLGQTLAPSSLDSLRYKPDTNYFGPDTFTWTASDGFVYAADSAITGLAIAPVNDTAVISPTSASAQERQPAGTSVWLLCRCRSGRPVRSGGLLTCGRIW
jgi:hypothetical protein